VDALPIYGYISTGAALSGTPSISCSATAASPASFNLNNADANADGSFTEADITATADIIMKR